MTSNALYALVSAAENQREDERLALRQQAKLGSIDNMMAVFLNMERS